MKQFISWDVPVNVYQPTFPVETERLACTDFHGVNASARAISKWEDFHTISLLPQHTPLM